MGTPYLGEIRIFPFNFPPKNWAFCNGQLLPIAQNQALFSLLGTNYGGNGQTTFALPNFQGRVAVGTAQSESPGQAGGELMHTVTISEMPAHNHFISARDRRPAATATVTPPGNTAVLARAFVPLSGGEIPVARYAVGAPSGTLSPASVATVGGSQPHENMQPYLALSICIALSGIFPSRN